jgi:GR25 family glycosyltransferase involved in LPS biosynthesis
MKLFSFCIYGNDYKYYFGLEENCLIINEYYPDYEIYIYCGITHLTDYVKFLQQKYKNIHLFETNNEGVVNMVYRYKPLLLNNVDVVIIRDADSEVNERDRWSINDFLNSNSKNDDKTDSKNKNIQIIRDNFWHKSRITGGLSLFRNRNNLFDKLKEKLIDIFANSKISLKYGDDENILNSQIYPIIKDYVLVYSNICVFEGEDYKNINFINDGTNFCGNVIEYLNNDGSSLQISKYISENIFIKVYKKYKFNYFEFDIMSQLKWLFEQKQYDIIIKVINEFGFDRIDNNEMLLYFNILALLKSNVNNLDLINECTKIYGVFYKYTIINEIKNTVPLFFNVIRKFGYKIIGTGDLNYEPKELEFVIYYGNYPDDYMSLPQSNKIYKHFIFRNDIILDRYEYNKCWDKIDRIFIMTLENCFERLNDTIMHLINMNAPINRIEEYIAVKDGEISNSYIGATQNHVNCIKKMIDKSYNTCLFLEDDFVFTSNIKNNQDNLLKFMNRDYEYNICFLSASKYHKRKDFDDLLIISKQICTTSSGYLLNKNTANLVYETVKYGYDKLSEGNLPPNEMHILVNKYCIDRYWSKLDKIFIFKNKLGYQKPSLSNITGYLNINLD